MGVVAWRKVINSNCARSTDALGHILSGHFEMYTTGMASLSLMNIEERLHLGLHKAETKQDRVFDEKMTANFNQGSVSQKFNSSV